MTKKGSGRGRVSPSAVTWCSSIASSSALCVFGVARFTSSARMSCAKIGPGWNLKPPDSRSYTDTPMMSAGSMSLVNWMRWKQELGVEARPPHQLVGDGVDHQHRADLGPQPAQVLARQLDVLGGDHLVGDVEHAPAP